MTWLHSILGELDQVYVGNTLAEWLRAAATFLIVLLVFSYLRRLIQRKKSAWKSLHNPALELLAVLLTNTRRFVRVIFGLYLAEKILTLPPAIDRVFDIVIVLGLAIQIALWASAALRHQIQRRHAPGDPEPLTKSAPIGVLMFVGQLVIWSLAALFALDNLGVNITALVAGLGVGGIAIALSVQTLLSDLFGSLTIAFDKPFVVGDMLRIDDIEGRVEHVSVRSTRLRSVTGEQVIMSNADVLKSRVRNLGRMAERRMLFRLLVAYEIPPEKVEQVAGIVRRVVESQPATRFAHCQLAALGPSALEFEVVYHVANRDDVQHQVTVDAVNRGIFSAFAAAGIALAYPTQRVLLSPGAGSLAPAP